MAFLEDISGFYGTGERNQQGQSLEEFLKEYNPKKYDSPSNTTDIVVLCSQEALKKWGQPLKVLLVKRSNHPSIGFWATPGGFVEMREDLYEGAARELEEETGVKNLPLKQMRTWGAWKRDPRWRVITTSFLALVEGELPVKAGDDAAEALWFDVKLAKEEQMPAEEKAEIWRLELENAEQEVRLWARVGVHHKGTPLLMEESYELLECEGIAVDHACILTQALLYLKERLLP